MCGIKHRMSLFADDMVMLIKPSHMELKVIIEVQQMFVLLLGFKSTWERALLFSLGMALKLIKHSFLICHARRVISLVTIWDYLSALEP